MQKCITESKTSMNCSPEIEADSKWGKTNIWKKLYKNALRLKICILIYVKSGKYENNQQS